MRLTPLLSVIVVFVCLLCCSCSKDDDNNNGGNSRTLKYEISGTFTGTVYASYTTDVGGTNNEVVTPPWSKEITYKPNVTAAIIAITGFGGQPGQQVTVVIKRGNTQVFAPTTATADADGGFSKPAPVVQF
ncbi:hypothetical protein LZZ85_17000 [Terrimonas sp. NA20]|uniref:Uncharacterized protein n=1 Tax=Terrimonas ginsenosidimutans TaxID=2908004 RepID=A0ABS9KUK2_9BACT|nr:hypothetical protein [Terrimonas ginsenosidimutans]MCG2615998.1 hypothetical protein [Terrimonas ginsenosidimutans]